MKSASMPRKRRLRVAQWATGYVGKHALKKVMEHPDLDLVGVRVFSKDKEGKDAGELCGLPPCGIKATRNIDDIIAQKPDCVLYMQEGCDFDDICRLLESGANIVTTRFEFLRAASMEPETRARVEAACKRGNTSIHSTGISPGFLTEALPLVLTSLSRRVDAVIIDEYANPVEGASPFMIFETLGYGKPISAVDEARLAWLKSERAPSLSLLADALGKPVDTVEAQAELAATLEPIEVPGEGGGFIQPGTLAAERLTISAMRKGKPFIVFRANWVCGPVIDADWEMRDAGWRIQIFGDTPLDITITLPIPREEMLATLPGYTAHRPINALHAVCDAPPGIVTTLDLPQIIADVREASQS